MSGKAVRETLAALGVIASLVFVGIEIGQNAEATRAATVLHLKDNWVQLNLTQIETPELIDAIDRVQDVGLDSADRRSQLQVVAMYRVLWHNWSNAYYQYRVGTLEDEQWLPLLSDMETESLNAHAWEVWDRVEQIWDQPFRSLMDSLRTANFGLAP